MNLRIGGLVASFTALSETWHTSQSDFGLLQHQRHGVGSWTRSIPHLLLQISCIGKEVHIFASDSSRRNTVPKINDIYASTPRSPPISLCIFRLFVSSPSRPLTHSTPSQPPIFLLKFYCIIHPHPLLLCLHLVVSFVWLLLSPITLPLVFHTITQPPSYRFTEIIKYAPYSLA